MVFRSFPDALGTLPLEFSTTPFLCLPLDQGGIKKEQLPPHSLETEALRGKGNPDQALMTYLCSIFQ